MGSESILPPVGERQVPTGNSPISTCLERWVSGETTFDTEARIGRIGKFNNPANPVVQTKSVPSMWITQLYEG